MARRLVERGVRFVQCFHAGWDHHNNLSTQFQIQCRDTDQPSAALVRDLKQRGLLDETLVIWGGEFGRTPFIQGDINDTKRWGRDHHPYAFTLWMAGAGVKPGFSLGETDDFAFNVVKDPVHVHDFQATVLHLLGIDHERLTFRFKAAIPPHRRAWACRDRSSRRTAAGVTAPAQRHFLGFLKKSGSARFSGLHRSPIPRRANTSSHSFPLHFSPPRHPAAPVPRSSVTIARWLGVTQSCGASRRARFARSLTSGHTTFRDGEVLFKLRFAGEDQAQRHRGVHQFRRADSQPARVGVAGDDRYQVDYGKGWYGKLRRIAAQQSRRGRRHERGGGDQGRRLNEYRIRAHGARIQSWINGVPALDYTEPEHIPQDGHIGIQIHGGGKTLVQVKEVTIEVLPALPDAPTWEELGGVEGVKAKLAPPKKGADAAPPAKRDIDYNAVATDAKTPEQERALFKLPDGFEAQLVAAEDPVNGIGKFVPIAFDQRGALWTTTAPEYPWTATKTCCR